MRKIITRTVVLVLSLALIALAVAAGSFYGRITDCKNRYTQSVRTWCALYSLQEELVYAVIYAESGGDPSAVSHAGAVGLMQLMPETAAWIAKREKIDYSPDMLTQPDQNIRLGCALIAYLKTRFGSVENILAAYNAGHAKVEQWLDDPRYAKDGVLTDIPYPETQNYVKKVCFLQKIYQMI